MALMTDLTYHGSFINSDKANNCWKWLILKEDRWRHVPWRLLLTFASRPWPSLPWWCPSSSLTRRLCSSGGQWGGCWSCSTWGWPPTRTGSSSPWTPSLPWYEIKYAGIVNVKITGCYIVGAVIKPCNSIFTFSFKLIARKQDLVLSK